MAKKLTINHDFYKRVELLMEKANELGVYIDFSCCNNRTFITDTTNDKEYELVDLDNNKPIYCFPAFTEYKILLK